jgi:hypothetical protein
MFGDGCVALGLGLYFLSINVAVFHLSDAHDELVLNDPATRRVDRGVEK